MTPLPKKKHTRSRSNQRRSVVTKLFLGTLAKCPDCGKLKEPHRACRYCGSHHRKMASK